MAIWISGPHKRNNIGRHWHDGCVGRTLELLFAQLLPGLQDIQDKKISCVLATPTPQRKLEPPQGPTQASRPSHSVDLDPQLGHSIDLDLQFDMIKNIK